MLRRVRQALVLSVALASCTTVPSVSRYTCLRDPSGMLRTGYATQLENGRVAFQPDDEPRDGRHVLVEDWCGGAARTRCVLRSCRLTDGITAAEREPARQTP